MNNKPSFYRQRFLLSLLQVIDRKITLTELQKHSFLFSRQHAMGYDFVPYKFGCYSFQLNKDIQDLADAGFVVITDKIKLIEHNPITWLKTADASQLLKYPEERKQLSGNNLISFIYQKHPYYAINSEIIDRVCTIGERSKIEIERAKITKDTSVIYTLGYEGMSLEAYINKLIKNNIQLLIDVRKNPVSRKFGFSYKTLNSLLPKIGIGYFHMPELGIEPSKRKGLDNKKAYEKLFKEYKATLTTTSKKDALNEVLDLQKKYKRIALTCFEKDALDCHRHCVSEYFSKHQKTTTLTIHL